MDWVQVLLLIVIVGVGVMLAVIGVQIVGILKEARVTLHKIDLITEDVGFLTRSVVRGSSTLTHLTNSMESGIQLIGLVTKLVSGKGKKNE